MGCRSSMTLLELALVDPIEFVEKIRCSFIFLSLSSVIGLHGVGLDGYLVYCSSRSSKSHIKRESLDVLRVC